MAVTGQRGRRGDERVLVGGAVSTARSPPCLRDTAPHRATADGCPADAAKPSARSMSATVARIAFNKLHALTPTTTSSRPPGRLDALKQLFLRWEGLLVGGFFLGGLGLFATRVYAIQRLEDVARRDERCALYSASCRMADDDLAAIQASLVFHQALLQAAQAHCSVQQRWLQQHECSTERAAQHLALWQGRCCRFCGLQQHQQLLEHSGTTQPGTQPGPTEQQQVCTTTAASTSDVQQDSDEEQQQQQEQQPEQQAEQQPEQQPHTLNVLCRVSWSRLQQAQRQLEQEQQELALVAAGLQLWQRIQAHSKSQGRMLLQRHHRQRQLQLAHQRQLGVWRQLPTNNSHLAVAFSVPSLGALLARVRRSSCGSSSSPEAACASVDGATVVQAGGDAEGQQQQQPGGASVSAASTQPPPHQAAAASGYSISVQLLLPHWIPSSLDEQDHELLAAAQQRHQQQHEQQQQQQPDGMASAAAAAAGEGGAEAREAEEVGVLAEVLDEAVDLMATLWEAAE